MSLRGLIGERGGRDDGRPTLPRRGDRVSRGILRVLAVCVSKENAVEALRRERRRFFWKIEGEVLFSDAFKEIARDGQTVTVYLLVLARQAFPPNRKERTRMEKAGLWPPKNTSFSFPVREAPFHGLTVRGLAHALRRLHEVGLIDRISSGSALKGDFAQYAMSERWRNFGKPTFRPVPWPKAATIGTRDKRGMFTRRRGRKSPVVANPATTKAPLVANPATTTRPVVVKSAINTCGKRASVVAESTMLLSSPSLDRDLRSAKGVKKKVRTLNPRSKGAAAASQQRINIKLPVWPDQHKVLGLCDTLLPDAINRHGYKPNPRTDELAAARRVTDTINRECRRIEAVH